MAFFPYFAMSPSAVMCMFGLLYGPDETIATPGEDYKQSTIDLVIPAYNEAKNIALCLESIASQTVKPSNILLVDDGSTDKTSIVAQEFANFIGLDLTILRREKTEGKTSIVHMAVKQSKADILFVLDADTTLRSPNYIERVMQEIHQGVGIASACGLVFPQVKGDREKLISTPTMTEFLKKFSEFEK